MVIPPLYHSCTTLVPCCTIVEPPLYHAVPCCTSLLQCCTACLCWADFVCTVRHRRAQRAPERQTASTKACRVQRTTCIQRGRSRISRTQPASPCLRTSAVATNERPTPERLRTPRGRPSHHVSFGACRTVARQRRERPIDVRMVCKFGRQILEERRLGRSAVRRDGRRVRQMAFPSFSPNMWIGTRTASGCEHVCLQARLGWGCIMRTATGIG